jgi:hypothetical protein
MWLPWARRGSGYSMLARQNDHGAVVRLHSAHVTEMMSSLCWHSPMGWSRRPVLLDGSSGDSSGPGSHRGCAETATHSVANNAQKSAMMSATKILRLLVLRLKTVLASDLFGAGATGVLRAAATHPQPCCPQRVGTLFRHLSFAFLCLLCTMSSSAKQAWRKVSTA